MKLSVHVLSCISNDPKVILKILIKTVTINQNCSNAKKNPKVDSDIGVNWSRFE